MESLLSRHGAYPSKHGVTYSVWAPDRHRVEVAIELEGGATARMVPLLRRTDGYYRGIDPLGRHGDLYRFRLDGGELYPDPASRWQPKGVHGPSEVIAPWSFQWRDTGWKRPAFRDLIIYELHLGTFTPDGTFRGAIDRLAYLRDLGINAIEIMPVADFPGARNWGYDGVQLFAPARSYGRPDEFRALVDAAHAAGIAVILDVVYNHFGPDGNYLRQFSSHYFSSEEKTPWGDSINFSHDQSEAVRDFFKANVVYWMQEFHVDGFRLDATHAIIDRSRKDILAELATLVHERGGYIIAEDCRNEARLITEPAEGGDGLDAVWADDFHHVIQVGAVEASVYRNEFTGSTLELATILERGWLYSGQFSKRKRGPRGTPTGALPPERFLFCISNHDQVGNRALGERLNHLVSAATYRAATALLLLSPYTPLLFMGQEWAASTPFQYFTDHEPELGRLVEEGRRAEFREAFAAHADLAAKFPSPQAEETFLHSKLNWAETAEPGHRQIAALYKALIQARQSSAGFRPRTSGTVHAAVLGADVLAVRLSAAGQERLLLCDLAGGAQGTLNGKDGAAPCQGQWNVMLSTNETRFGGNGDRSFDPETGQFCFSEPGLILFRGTA